MKRKGDEEMVDRTKQEIVDELASVFGAIGKTHDDRDTTALCLFGLNLLKELCEVA